MSDTMIEIIEEDYEKVTRENTRAHAELRIVLEKYFCDLGSLVEEKAEKKTESADAETSLD
jgi:hypothetical protein